MMPRDIIYFEQSDMGKQVKFTPHENETIYENCLIGKVGTIKSVRKRVFDQEVVVDFNYVLDFGKDPIIETLIFKTSDRNKIIKDIVNRKVIFHKYSPFSENIPTVHTTAKHWHYVSVDKPDLFVEERLFDGGFYFGYDVPTTSLEIVTGYKKPLVIGPIWKVSGHNLIFQENN